MGRQKKTPEEIEAEIEEADSVWTKPYFAILEPDHFKMLAVWCAVPVASESGDGFDGKEPDLFRWAQLSNLRPERVRELWPILREFKMVLPDRTLPGEVEPLVSLWGRKKVLGV